VRVVCGVVVLGADLYGERINDAGPQVLTHDSRTRTRTTRPVAVFRWLDTIPSFDVIEVLPDVRTHLRQCGGTM
jgi:hypothetical protein